MKKIMLIIFIVFVVISGFYGYLVLASKKKYPIKFGISFNQNHAASLGLDWREAYEAMLKELKPEHIRIAAMWSEVEPQKDSFVFDDIDWMIGRADYYDVRVMLVVGQKAPRWPECHVPNWVSDLSENEYRTRLLQYVTTVVSHYKNHQALELWQVENEPFIHFRFGECSQFKKELVYDEIKTVRMLDDKHKIIITDSGELGFWKRAIQAGDLFGTTLYRIVRTPHGRIWTYDWLPAEFYRLKARIMGANPDNIFVSELQAEPWFTDGTPDDTPIGVQEQTMNIGRLQKHINYVGHVGALRAYFWGAEWWYWMKTKQNDGRYWDLIRNTIAESVQ